MILSNTNQSHQHFQRISLCSFCCSMDCSKFFSSRDKREMSWFFCLSKLLVRSLNTDPRSFRKALSHFSWNRRAFSSLFLRERFFKYYFKNGCEGFIRFPNARKHFTWFYCFRAFKTTFPIKKSSRNYHFKTFSEFKHILFETWKVD